MKTMIKSIFIFTLLFFIQFNAFSKIKVNVGGYNFLPFVFYQSQSEKYLGLSKELINSLNHIQNEYKFEFIQTTSKRRFLDMDEGSLDLILFEDYSWGWKSYPVQKSNVFLKGGEVYITKRLTGIEQSYFDDIKNKKIVGVLGYHYGFANFNSNVTYLKKNFDISLTSNVASSVEMILHDRAEIAVINVSYLNFKIKQNPKLQYKIFRSEKFDQLYNLRAIIREKSPISVLEFNKLIKLLVTTGELRKIYNKYGIEFDHMIFNN